MAVLMTWANTLWGHSLLGEDVCVAASFRGLVSVSWGGENARCGNKGFSGWPVVVASSLVTAGSRISLDFLGAPWRPFGAFPGAECTWSCKHGLGVGLSLRT